MLDKLPGVQVVGVIGGAGTIGVVENDDVETQVVPVEGSPGVLRQYRRIGAVEQAVPVRLDRVEQGVHRRVVVGRKRRHAVRTGRKGLQRLDLVDLEIQALAGLGIEQARGSEIALEQPRRPVGRGGRGLEVQARRRGHAVLWTTYEEVGGVQVVRVGMRLQAVAHAR
jgi:hypothetical protein